MPYPPARVDLLALLHAQPHAARPYHRVDQPSRAAAPIGTRWRHRPIPTYPHPDRRPSFVISASVSQSGYALAKSFAPVGCWRAAAGYCHPRRRFRRRTSRNSSPSEGQFPALNCFGLGTLPQILGETFKAVTKTDIVSIPYKGGAQAITDMLGGRIQLNFGTPPTLLPLIQQGKIRALAVTTDARYREMPDVPTMSESGLPQLALTFSAGVLAPTGTPEPVLDALNAAFREALKSPELTASMAKLGFAPEPWTRAQYATFLAEEMKKWPPIVQASGIKAEVGSVGPGAAQHEGALLNGTVPRNFHYIRTPGPGG